MADTKKSRMQEEMPDDVRRRDPGPDRPDSLPEVAEDVAHAGISPSPDGDNPEHPIHDEDIEDLGPEDFEEMIDRNETRPVDKVIPK
ncbi:hypothetical protein [Pseudorhodoplanes sp.]|uniref:hypothetical protein n=1 Tax=Pseudorhodoplanes sp. TaxID=1934341 RepID=UPI002B7B0D87|nr:hypothetical protein [Pseudorhodoplanes sp.]HWV54099.1 hypothetical protein [Pseudorhodoplanes sp.]